VFAYYDAVPYYAAPEDPGTYPEKVALYNFTEST
jgi:hypothetical protein